jgi:hypothetical protein
MAKARQVNIESGLQQYIEKLISENPQVERFINGIKWRLARGPEDGKPTDRDPNRYFLKFQPPSDNLPVIGLIYEFDEATVTISRLHAFPQN